MTFRVFGGIPVSAIHSFDMWHVDKDKAPKIKLQ